LEPSEPVVPFGAPEGEQDASETTRFRNDSRDVEARRGIVGGPSDPDKKRRRN